MSVKMMIVMAGMIAGGALAGLLALRAFRRGHYLRFFYLAPMGLVFILTAAILVLLATGAKDYAAFNREEWAATVYITPLGNQQFQARVVRPRAPDTTLVMAGDELYMDARIIKWKPIINRLGWHTSYRLDRVSGRYADIQDEKTKGRTLHSLAGGMKPWDVFRLRAKYKLLAPLLDAQYGSAAFVPVKDRNVLRVMVTTSGLLIRPEPPPEN